MKVAVYFATGYEEVEALAVVDVLRRGGVDVSMVGVTGKSVASARQISINMDQTIEEVDHSQIDMMVLPGGLPGVDNLKANETVVQNLKAFKKEGKWLAAICAAPSILGELGLLEGEKATCYPGFEDKLLGAQVVNERTVISGKVITGKGAGTALEFGLAILSVIKEKELAHKVAKGMIVID